MSGWLSRARDALKGKEAAVPTEPVEIACPCGRKIEALRRLGFQRVLCKGCGEPFLLLPLDVYPRPVMKVRKVKAPKEQAARKAVPTKDAPARSILPDINVRPLLAAVGRRARAQVTPLRLIVVSLLAVVMVTGWWQWQQAALSRAAHEFRTESEAGWGAIQQREFADALEHYRRASAAADLLRRSDVEAEQTRQRFRQLKAIQSLLSRSLVEVLEAAHESRQKRGAAEAESEFANLHTGRWVVLQANVAPSGSASHDPTSQPDELRNSTAAPIWDQRVDLNSSRLRMTASLAVFAKIPATSPVLVAQPAAEAADGANVPPDAAAIASPVINVLDDLGQREVIFAAQLQSLKWDADNSEWVLTFDPASGFLWTDFELLAEVGLGPDELRTEAQLRWLLREQGRWIGAAK